MPHVLNADMSDTELLIAVARDYACESNWQKYEKQYDDGRPVMRSPWSDRDKGAHARRALEIIEGRKNDKSNA